MTATQTPVVEPFQESDSIAADHVHPGHARRDIAPDDGGAASGAAGAGVRGAAVSGGVLHERRLPRLVVGRRELDSSRQERQRETGGSGDDGGPLHDPNPASSGSAAGPALSRGVVTAATVGSRHPVPENRID